MSILREHTLPESKWLLLCLLLPILATDCADEMPAPPPDRVDSSNQLLVVNEGPFQNGTGSLTAYDPMTGVTVDEVFQRANPNAAPLGNILQSIARTDETTWMVVNNANRIVVCNSEDLQERARWPGFDLPRYLLPLDDNTAVVTQWGADLKTGSLAFVNLQTGEVEQTLPLGPGPEAPLRLGNRLYVPQSGGLGRDSTLAVVDLDTRTVVDRLPAGQNPQSMVRVSDREFWSLGQGYIENFGNPDDPANRPGVLVQFVDDVEVFRTQVPLSSKHLRYNPNDGRFYFLSGGVYGKITRWDPAAQMIQTLTERTFYEINYRAQDDRLYASDPGNFQGRGQVLILQTDGAVVDSFPAGLGTAFILD